MDSRRKTTMSVREMGTSLGLKKVDSYWLVQKEYFKTILVNGKMRVVIESFEEWYAGQVKYRKVDGPPPGERLKAESYSPREIAELLGISEAYAYEVIRKNEIPTITVDYRKRIRKEDFDQWYKGQDRYLLKQDRMILEAFAGETISLPEMARILNVTRKTVYSIAKSPQGKKYLKEVMVGGQRRVTKESFEEWYASQTQYLKPSNEPEDCERKPITTSSNPNLLTIDEAAQLAGVRRSAIYKWIQNGRISAVTYSRKLVRIRRAEFEEYLALRREKEEKKKDGINYPER